VVALNIAMSLNPVSLIVIGIGLLIAGLAVAYTKFEGFRKIVNLVFDGIKFGFEILMGYFKTLLGVYKGIFNGFASIWNNTIGKIQIKIPDIKGLPGRGETFGVPKIPMLAEGGIVVNGAQLAVIGEAGPEAVIPLDRMGEFARGGGGDINVTIHVNGGDPNAVVAALQRYVRTSGPVPILVRNP
jgi:phage-related protein